MSGSDAYAQPMKVVPQEDCVVLLAPDGPGAVALTPEAALESAERIAEAARALIAARTHIG